MITFGMFVLCLIMFVALFEGEILTLTFAILGFFWLMRLQ